MTKQYDFFTKVFKFTTVIIIGLSLGFLVHIAVAGEGAKGTEILGKMEIQRGTIVISFFKLDGKIIFNHVMAVENQVLYIIAKIPPGEGDNGGYIADATGFLVVCEEHGIDKLPPGVFLAVRMDEIDDINISIKLF